MKKTLLSLIVLLTAAFAVCVFVACGEDKSGIPESAISFRDAVESIDYKSVTALEEIEAAKQMYKNMSDADKEYAIVKDAKLELDGIVDLKGKFDEIQVGIFVSKITAMNVGGFKSITVAQIEEASLLYNGLYPEQLALSPDNIAKAHEDLLRYEDLKGGISQVALGKITDYKGMIVLGQSGPHNGKSYTLENDIEYDGIPLAFADKNISGLGIFDGKLNGKGHKIIFNGSAPTDGSHYSFVGLLTDGGVIENITFEGTVADFGWWSYIVAADMNYGTTIQNCVINVAFSGAGNDAYCSGIVSKNLGTVKNCIVIGPIDGKGAAWGPLNVPIMMEGTGTVADCYFDYEVVNAAGTMNSSSELYTNFARTTAWMKTAANFSAFDTSIWNLVDGQYPSLKPMS